MPAEEQGIKRAVKEIIYGTAPAFVITTLWNFGFRDSSVLRVLHLGNVLLSISLLLKMKYWGTPYIVGWLIGVLLMLPTGLLGTFESILYPAVPVFYLIRRNIRTED